MDRGGPPGSLRQGVVRGESIGLDVQLEGSAAIKGDRISGLYIHYIHINIYIYTYISCYFTLYPIYNYSMVSVVSNISNIFTPTSEKISISTN